MAGVRHGTVSVVFLVPLEAWRQHLEANFPLLAYNAWPGCSTGRYVPDMRERDRCLSSNGFFMPSLRIANLENYIRVT